MKFIIQYSPTRADLLTTMTDIESSAIAAHFNYLKQLLSAGRLLFAGRRLDAAYGIAIFEAESQLEAEGVVAQDPAITAGVFSANVGEFQFALSADPSLL